MGPLVLRLLYKNSFPHEKLKYPVRKFVTSCDVAFLYNESWPYHGYMSISLVIRVYCVERSPVSMVETTPEERDSIGNIQGVFFKS